MIIIYIIYYLYMVIIYIISYFIRKSLLNNLPFLNEILYFIIFLYIIIILKKISISFYNF